MRREKKKHHILALASKDTQSECQYKFLNIHLIKSF